VRVRGGFIEIAGPQVHTRETVRDALDWSKQQDRITLARLSPAALGGSPSGPAHAADINFQIIGRRNLVTVGHEMIQSAQ